MLVTLSVLSRLCLSISDGNIVGLHRGLTTVLADFFPLALKEQNTLLYRPFGPFSRDENPGTHQVANIESLIAAEKWYEARQASAQLIQMSLAGLHYLQT